MSAVDAMQLRGLSSLHFLIDSSVYIRAHVQIGERLFSELREVAEEFGLVLHSNDLIHLEVGRWLTEQGVEIAAEQKRLRRKIEAWNRRLAGRELPVPAPMDGTEIAEHAIRQFRIAIARGFTELVHDVGEVPSCVVVERYKTGAPPFAQRGSKEFPDALIVESTRRWAVANNTKVYVVSEDAAMLEDAGSTESLIPVRGLSGFLSIVAQAKDPSVIALLEEMVDEAPFMDKLIDALADGLPSANFVYNGHQLDEASVEDVELRTYDASRSWSIVSVHGPVIAFVCFVSVTANLTVRYVGPIEDEDGGRDFGTDEWDERIEGRIYFKYDRTSDTIAQLEFLTPIDFEDSPNWGSPYD